MALEQTRSLSNGALHALALNPKEGVELRIRALLAIGRIQNPASTETVATALTNKDPAIRQAAAFSAGLLGLSWVPLPESNQDRLTKALLAAEAKETKPDVGLELLLALSRVGSVPRLVDRLDSKDPKVAARAALGVGIIAKRTGTFPPAALIPLLNAKATPEVLYALARTKSPLARPKLLRGLNHPDAYARAQSAIGLGDVGEPNDAMKLEALLRDEDTSVAIEAARSLAKLAKSCNDACPALVALRRLNDLVDVIEQQDPLSRHDAEVRATQALLAVAQQGLPHAGDAILDELRRHLQGVESRITGPELRRDLLKLDCRLAAAVDAHVGKPEQTLACGKDSVPEALRLTWALQAIAATHPTQAEALIPYLSHPSARVKVAALEAVSGTGSAVSAVHALLDSGDGVVAADAATPAVKLHDPHIDASMRELISRAEAAPELAPSVADAIAEGQLKAFEPDMRRWLKSSHATVRQSAATTLSKLTGQTVSPPFVERQPPADEAGLPTEHDHLVLVTEKGEIEIRLFNDDAPITAPRMAWLAKKQFFDRTPFHRIVPGFVAQGGDPRGDGEGGPGFDLPCEINHHPYTRGAVGMALSGKDTGGSQFFITLTPQPHLDGRYTVFGEVVSGMEVADRLLEDDRILRTEWRAP